MSGSPPSTPKAVTGIAALSVRETEILGKAWSCLKTGPPEIDYEKLAAELNMANPRSAANAWGAIKKKMAWSTTATPATAKSTGGKRKKADTGKAPAADDSEDDHENGSPPPAKKKKAAVKPRPTRQKAAPKTAKIVAAKDVSDGEEGSAGEVAEQPVKSEAQVKAEPEHEVDSGDDAV